MRSALKASEIIFCLLVFEKVSWPRIITSHDLISSFVVNCGPIALCTVYEMRKGEENYVLDSIGGYCQDPKSRVLP